MGNSRGKSYRINVNHREKSASSLFKTSLLAAYASILLILILDGVSASVDLKSVPHINSITYTNSNSEYQSRYGGRVEKQDFVNVLKGRRRYRFIRTASTAVDVLNFPNDVSIPREVQQTVQCHKSGSVLSDSQGHDTLHNTVTSATPLDEENKLPDGDRKDTASGKCICFNRSLPELKCDTINVVNKRLIYKIPEGIMKLSATHSNLTALPFVTEADGLLSLDVSHNIIVSINISVLTMLENLSEMDLSWNELTEIDITQANLKFLSCINVSFNKLKKFSSKRFQIKVLNLSQNFITNISFVSILRDLERLDLSHNVITYIPEETFRSLSQLKYLHLSHNQIVDTTFLTNVNKGIKSIHLSNNLIEHVLMHLSKFTQLIEIYLDCNAISDTDFSKIPQYLDTLNLTNNKVKRVERIRDKFLLNFYLANNSLSNIKFISSMKSIIKIDVSNNNLQNIDYDIVLHSPFTELTIDSTNLSSVDFMAKNLDKIKILSIKNNNISCFPFSKLTMRDSKLYLENNPVRNLLCPVSHRERLRKCTVDFQTQESEYYLEISWTGGKVNDLFSCLKKMKILETCYQKLCAGGKTQYSSYHLLIVSLIFVIIQ